MLKYLFQVEYRDGTIFTQTQDDVSVKDPTKSAFFDVQVENVKTFTLFGEDTVTVDLTDGHFEVNGVSFIMHDEELSNFRPVYFRRHRHAFNVEMEETGHQIFFRVGWQANDKDGKNYQRVMEIH